MNPFNGKIVPHALPWLSFKELQVGVKDDRRKFGQNHTDAQFSLGQTEGDLAEPSGGRTNSCVPSADEGKKQGEPACGILPGCEHVIVIPGNPSHLWRLWELG